jgi:hypothetical protein
LSRRSWCVHWLAEQPERLAVVDWSGDNIVAPARGNFRGWSYEVSGNYFQMLGVTPKQGRFGGDPEIVGKTLKISVFPFTIIGVAGPTFKGSELIVAGEYWVVLSMIQQVEPGNA